MMGKAETAFPVTYAGGSLPLRHDKVTAKLRRRGHHIYAARTPHCGACEKITAISCGSEVRRRFGAAVLGVVPWMQLDKAEKDYVGVTWNEDARKMEVLFKLSSREYRDFLAALEAPPARKQSTPTRCRWWLPLRHHSLGPSLQIEDFLHHGEAFA